MIPDDLHPSWRHVPALAWLATDRFQPPVLDVPVLRRAGQVMTWPAFLLEFSRAVADGNAGRWEGRAVITVQELHAEQHRTWRTKATTVACALGIGAVYLAPTALLYAAAGHFDDAADGWVAAGLLLAAVGVLSAQILPGSAQVLPSAVAGLQRQRHRAQGWALQPFDRVAEASNLVADPADRRAVSPLVLGPLRVADRDQITVLAQPPTAALAKLYERFGFSISLDRSPRNPRITRCRTWRSTRYPNDRIMAPTMPHCAWGSDAQRRTSAPLTELSNGTGCRSSMTVNETETASHLYREAVSVLRARRGSYP
ncbi:hypothetical protein ACPPVO_22890 [Dactylosporangium sp. McL0621]|uniref:hypothetical protein n=1 Tax=Dactylosporangium sp. McL0621 TaxID=3415678 RepID=UPI003CF72519